MNKESSPEQREQSPQVWVSCVWAPRSSERVVYSVSQGWAPATLWHQEAWPTSWSPGWAWWSSRKTVFSWWDPVVMWIILDFSIRLLILGRIIGLSGNGNHFIISSGRRRPGHVGRGPGDHAALPAVIGHGWWEHVDPAGVQGWASSCRFILLSYIMRRESRWVRDGGSIISSKNVSWTVICFRSRGPYYCAVFLIDLERHHPFLWSWEVADQLMRAAPHDWAQVYILYRIWCYLVCGNSCKVQGDTCASMVPLCLIFFSILSKRKVKLLSRVQLFATPWPVADKAPPSMGFSRQG